MKSHLCDLHLPPVASQQIGPVPAVIRRSGDFEDGALRLFPTCCTPNRQVKLHLARSSLYPTKIHSLPTTRTTSSSKDARETHYWRTCTSFIALGLEWSELHANVGATDRCSEGASCSTSQLLLDLVRVLGISGGTVCTYQ